MFELRLEDRVVAAPAVDENERRLADALLDVMQPHAIACQLGHRRAKITFLGMRILCGLATLAAA